MAFFKRKKEKVKEIEPKVQETKEVEAKTASVQAVRVLNTVKDHTHVLLRPRITEKATYGVEGGAYVFEIDPRATKHDVAHAVEAVYKVKPRKVNITQIRSKRVAPKKQRGVFGTKGGGKKAYVYLKEGETINIV